MKLLKYYLIFNAIAFIPYGLMCFFNATLLLQLLGMQVASNTALIEFRAMYGGVQTALGLFALYCALQPAIMRTGLVALTLCYAGLSIGRASGIMQFGNDGYNGPALIFEGVSLLICVLLLLRTRAANDNAG